MSAPDVSVHAIEFRVSVLPADHIDADIWSLTVSWQGQDRWMVRRGRSWRLSRNGSLDLVPSEPTVNWIAAHRFEFAEAIRLAIAHAPSIKANGLTATEVLERMNAPEEVAR